MVAVSSCLADIVCKYNAADIYNAELMNSIGEDYIPICPELLAGLACRAYRLKLWTEAVKMC